ncbi:Rha family transcriptional regulator [Ignatzschineria indica]|nr:Rha family transcriptional regulator [Ignatzschineria indica]
MTDSLIVAEVFGKDHGKVLRDIRQLITEIESFGGRSKFG